MSDQHPTAPAAIDIITRLLAERAAARRRFFLPALVLAMLLTAAWAWFTGPISTQHLSALSLGLLGAALVLGGLVLPLVCLEGLVLPGWARVGVLLASLALLGLGCVNVLDLSTAHTFHSSCATGEVLGALIALALFSASGALLEPRSPVALAGLILAATTSASVAMALACPWTNVPHVLGSHLGTGLLLAAAWMFGTRFWYGRDAELDPR